MRYYYDASGFISSATVYTLSNGNVTGTYTYLYRTNIQGDVVGVYATDGTLLISYIYDAWGNFQEITHTSSQDTAIASSLPFRYRSYYYDTELGMYYLNTRYYDPAIGRFINADGAVSTGQGLLGNNMYSYCGNNPVSRKDPNGKSFIAAVVITLVITVIATHKVKKQMRLNNYRNNSNLDSNESTSTNNMIISSQYELPAKDFMYGYLYCFVLDG